MLKKLLVLDAVVLVLCTHFTEEEPPPAEYSKCAEIGITDAGELSNFVLEWNLLPDPEFRLQIAFHGKADRGFVGIGFEDTGKGHQIVDGYPSDDIHCIRAMYDNATELNAEGVPYDNYVELPGVHQEQSSVWAHNRIERNLTIGTTSDPFSEQLRFTILWAIRWSAVVDGTCQDIAGALPISEFATFSLDLLDAGNNFNTPVISKKKEFTNGEPRCTPLSSHVTLETSSYGGGNVLFSEGLLAGETHQVDRIAVLLIGGGTGPIGGSLGLRSGEENPTFSGTLKVGENLGNACQDTTSKIIAGWTGFSDPIGGISHYTITLRDYDVEDLLLDDVYIGHVTYIEYPVNLNPNSTVQLQVSAWNHAGLSTTVSSNWIRVLNNQKAINAEYFNGVDDNGVTAQYQGQAKHILWWSVQNTFQGYWTGYVREDKDVLSPTTGEWTSSGTYSYAVGKVGGSIDSVVGWTSTAETSFSETALSLDDGGQYYFTVHTTNCAGVTSVGTSNQITVDLTPPVVGVVFDGNVTMTDSAVIQPWEPLWLSWSFFSDATSGIHHYEWSAGTQKHVTSTEIISWQNVGLTTAADTLDPVHGNSSLDDLRTLGVTVGDVIYLHVRAYDNAGHFSTATSNGTQLVIY
eukprot:TRINITY_DN19354_c0_g1_i1.p1 TRINITY_DN19354_c0_g1~~TRINITY_DN19354_c0_g1_i1.p1  ORF type:complete len:654 (+),score=107.29 TRINITY_DN19354_c0_g1_i1:69-1964(+)